MRAFLLLFAWWCLIALASAAPSNLPRGNFWPNATFEQGDNLDAPDGTPTGWKRGGSNPAICQVAQAGAAPNHALAVVDDGNGYGEWYSDLSLAGRVSAGDQIDLQWFEMYEVFGTEMRVTVLFLGAGGNLVDVKHFVARGTSDGYTGDLASSTFTKRNETIDVPEGAATLRISLVSGGSVETTGFMAIDDLSVARHPAPILLAGNLWTNSPTFEEGTNLDQPLGTPMNWRRGGVNTNILQVTTNASISPSHALAALDNSSQYGEWYSDLPLSNLVRAGDTLNLQWFEMYNVVSGGEMRVTVLMLSAGGGVIDARHFVARGRSQGWAGSIAASSFTQRNESLLVPEGAVTMRVSLVSGGSPETTGTMVIDDFSMNKAEPPLPDVLPGNVWPNADFEQGENLRDPANAVAANWERGGTDPGICLLSSENSVSRAHALAVADENADGYGEWHSDFTLGAATAPGKTLDVQWFELFNVRDGEMRVTFLFLDANNQVAGQSHFVVQGPSSGWKGSAASSTFTRRNEKVAVPPGARKLRVSLVSGGPAATRGLMLIDNLSVAPEANEPVTLFGNFWTNPGFEQGTDLDDPAVARPAGWSRGGADPAISQVTTEGFMSFSHALALVDAKSGAAGEWQQSLNLPGHASPGEPIQAQWWEMFDVANGEMSLTVSFLNGEQTLETHNYAARGSSSGWNGSIARSFFTKRSESLTVPANATRMLVRLASGGPVETTGVMVIDDLSFAKPPPPPDILSGNLWPNPAFEEGTQLDKPTLGVPDGGWQRGGTLISGDQIVTTRAKSPTHALAVIDNKEDGYSEWYIQKPLAGWFAPGDLLDAQWYELYDTSGNMRVSFNFRGSDQAIIAQRHFEISGQSPGWTGDLATSPFVKRREQVEVPDGAVSIMVTLTSGGPASVTGTYIIDDFSLRVARNEFRVTSLRGTAGGWELTWESQPGKSYAIESSPTLGPGAFQLVPGFEAVPAVDFTTSIVDSRANPDPARFYRVIQLP